MIHSLNLVCCIDNNVILEETVSHRQKLESFLNLIAL